MSKCDKCGKPILPSQARYALPGVDRHWSCHEKSKEEFTSLQKKFHSNIDKLRGTIEHLKRR